MPSYTFVSTANAFVAPIIPAFIILFPSLVTFNILNSLKLNERKIVVLHAISGLRHREIAKLLDMPLGTVLSTYNRAINKIKKHLEGGNNCDK